MPKSTGSRYTKEFKAEAVQLARSSPERSIRQLAYELGIADQTLRNWIRQAQIDRGEREGLSTEEREELRRLRRENKVLREEREILKKVLRPSSRRKTGLGEHLQIHRGGEGHLLRPCAMPHARCLSQRLLRLEEQATVREGPLRRGALSEDRDDPPQQPGNLRSARVHAELMAIGIRCSRKRVARLMRRARLRGSLRGRRMRTTSRTTLQQVAPDLVERNFLSEEPDRLWVADITYVRSAEGFLYLSFILDACSRKVVGWSMATHLRTELVVDALQMAIARRKPSPGLVHHSDRGVPYTSLSFGKRLEDEGLLPSMGRVGSAYDNALAESFVATLKTELLYRNTWPTRQAVRTAIFEYIESFYNTRRRHSALGYLSPAEFEEVRLEEEHAA